MLRFAPRSALRDEVNLQIRKDNLHFVSRHSAQAPRSKRETCSTSQSPNAARRASLNGPNGSAKWMPRSSVISVFDKRTSDPFSSSLRIRGKSAKTAAFPARAKSKANARCWCVDHLTLCWSTLPAASNHWPQYLSWPPTAAKGSFVICSGVIGKSTARTSAGDATGTTRSRWMRRI